MEHQPGHLSRILILDALTALTPFSIDMYLPTFPQIAQAFGTNVAHIAFSLSSYFIGLATGQLIYGPLMDRFGRKKPMFVGISIYILATIGCALSKSRDVVDRVQICPSARRMLGGRGRVCDGARFVRTEREREDFFVAHFNSRCVAVVSRPRSADC